MNQTDLITLAKAGFTKDDILVLQQAMAQPQMAQPQMAQPQMVQPQMAQPQMAQPYPQGTQYIPVLPQTAPQYQPSPVVADPLGEALKNMRQSQAAGMGNDYNLNSVVGSIIGSDK